MHDNNIASTIFAGGMHVPWTTRALATLFIVVRLMTVLALPEIVLTRLGLIFLAYRKSHIGGSTRARTPDRV